MPKTITKKPNPVAKELITNRKYLHKKERSYKERVHLQNDQEHAEELKHYLKETNQNGN